MFITVRSAVRECNARNIPTNNVAALFLGSRGRSLQGRCSASRLHTSLLTLRTPCVRTTWGWWMRRGRVGRRVLAAPRLGRRTPAEGRPPLLAAAPRPGNTAPCSLGAANVACMAALGGGHAPQLVLLQHLLPTLPGAGQVVLRRPPGACRREAFTSPPAWPRRRGGGHPSAGGAAVTAGCAL